MEPVGALKCGQLPVVEFWAIFQNINISLGNRFSMRN